MTTNDKLTRAFAEWRKGHGPDLDREPFADHFAKLAFEAGWQAQGQAPQGFNPDDTTSSATSAVV
jgi:hypothetical protein